MIVRSYRSRPVNVRAVKVWGTPEQARKIVEWIKQINSEAEAYVLAGANDGEVAVEVYVGDVNFVVTKGHWLVVKGDDFYTMSDDKFNSLYMPTGPLFF